MRSLFDVNVLIALLDVDHHFHHRAHDWWGREFPHGWASCPLTENGFLRILTNPNYSKTRDFTVKELTSLLARFIAAGNHEFWPDALTLRDGSVFTTDRIHSGRQLTDVYLLGLATAHQARLVTFGEGVSSTAVKKSHARNLAVL